MSGDHRSREGIEIVASPAVMMGRWTADHGCVGHPTGDDDVGPGGEGLDDPPTAEVRVRRHERGRVAEPAGVRSELAKVAARCELGDTRQQVVTVDVGDPWRYAEPVGDLGQLLGATGRVETPGVGDDGDPPIETGAHDLLHLGDEGGGEAAARPFGSDPREDQHGQLGEPVTGENVDWAPVDHLASGREPVAEEAGAVCDPDRITHDASPVSSTTRRSPMSTRSPTANRTSATTPAVGAVI